MAFVKIWIHLVYETKHREAFLTKEIRDKLISHIKDYSRKNNIYIDAINGYTEHLHCLISLGADQSIAKITNLIKGESSHWINKEKLLDEKFNWGEDYYASSVSDSNINSVRNYIRNQEEHHRRRCFAEEYDEFISMIENHQLG